VADSKGSAEALSGSSEDREPAKGASSSKTVKEPRRRFGNPITRLARFFREVVAELRKVIYPTRQELLTYTGVVVVFVVIMVAVVFGLDWVFHKGVLFVFGNPSAK
jgi:preprotein translocase subunit SecE